MLSVVMVTKIYEISIFQRFVISIHCAAIRDDFCSVARWCYVHG